MRIEAGDVEFFEFIDDQLIKMVHFDIVQFSLSQILQGPKGVDGGVW